MIQNSTLLTKKELEVIKKRLANKKLSQQDSNYLSKKIRPKLREMSSIDSRDLLNKLEYRQDIAAIEKKIKNLVLKNVKNVSSITLYGSVIQNNYKNYNDIDVLVTVKNKAWEKLSEKYRLITEIKKKAKNKGLSLDLEMYTDKEVYDSHPMNITLVYQLNDSKTIYGKLNLPSEIEIPKIALRMKADYSIIDDSSGLETYRAIRNLWIIRLVMQRVVNNHALNRVIEDELGKNTVQKLKSNKETAILRKIAQIYLKSLLKETLNNLERSKWEKIKL